MNLNNVRVVLLCIFLIISTLEAICQCPSSDFLLSEDTICSNEGVQFTNNSLNAASYLWDFCTDDLLVGGEVNSSFSFNAFGRISSVRLLEEGESVAALSSRNNDKIALIVIEDSLNEVITSEQVNIISSVLFSGPEGIYLIKEENLWYGLVTNFSLGVLTRVEFGESLMNINPDFSEVQLPPGVVLSQASGVEIIKQGGNIVAVIANRGRNEIVRLNFGSSVSNEPVSGDVLTASGLSLPRTIRVVQECNMWHGFVLALGGDQIFHFDFGSDVLSTPTITKIAKSGSSLSVARDLSIVKEGNNYYGFAASSSSGSLFRISLGEDLNAIASAEIENIGNLGSLSNSLGFDIRRSKGKFIGFWVDTQLRSLKFESPCSASIPYSIDETPVNLNFSMPGSYPVSLIAYNNDKQVPSTKVDTFTVLSTASPIIDVERQEVCLSEPSTFSGNVISGTVSSFQWDFGDGSPSASGQEVTHQYTTPGTYEVTLEVESDDGCSNRLTKEVTIYEPPDPEFLLPAGVICTNGAIALNNLTDTKGADSLITYQWLVDGEMVSEEANPSIVFEEGGNKILRLAASIPGCTETFETTVNVIQGPTVNFALPPQLCAGEVIKLENQTSGDNITDYEWDFGDGGTLETLSSETVEYTFAEAGTYNIVLTANTSSGCANVATQTVTVFEQPKVGFTSDVACAGAATLFSDTTTAGSNANIIAWNWDFGDDSGTSEVRNPSYSYASPGTYTVSLTTQSSGGCAATSTQEVIVESPVSPEFTVSQVCPTEANPFLYQFEDNSTIVEGEIIVQRLWTINGENFTNDAVTYPFTEAGTYEVSLTAFASSGCNALLSKSVEVRALPEVRFEVATGCVGEAVTLVNQSGLNGWEAAQYTWDIASVGTVFETSPTVVFSEAGEFPITLTLETKTDCTFSWDSTITIQPAPLAAFEVAQLSGGSPLTISPTNLSTDYTQVQWHINEELVSEEIAPSFTLDEQGAYELELIAMNDIGCSDTARQIIEVVNPTIDVAVGELLRLENDDTSSQFVLSIENQGTLAVSDMTVLVQLGDVVALTEQVNEILLPGQRLNYPLQANLTDVRNQRTPVEYICASVSIDGETGSNLNVISESDTADNRACVALSAPLLVETPFPNPVGDEVVVSVLLETPQAVQLRLISSMGELLLFQQLPDAQQGLNTVVLDVSQTPAGIYTLEVTAVGQTVSQRVIVRP